MMDLLVSMVRNLVIVIIIATLLELVMPPGKLKPLIQMTIGFFVIITILNPILSLIWHNQQLSISAFVLPDEINSELNQAMITGQSVNKEMQADMNEQYKSRLEGQIRSLTMLTPGVGDIKPIVKLDSSGKIAKIDLLIASGDEKISDIEEKLPAFASRLPSQEDKAMEEKLKNWISSYYDVSPEQIKINWR